MIGKTCKAIITAGIILAVPASWAFSTGVDDLMHQAGKDAEEFYDDDVKAFLADRDREYRQFEDEADRDVQSFIDQADRDFAEFLKDDWAEFFFEEPARRLPDPKPLEKPVYTPPPEELTEPEQAVINIPVPAENPADKEMPPDTVQASRLPERTPAAPKPKPDPNAPPPFGATC